MKTTKSPPVNGHRIDIAQLVSSKKEELAKAHEALMKQAEKMGEKEGTLGLPLPEDRQLSPSEMQLRNEYQKLVAECWKKGKPYLDGPHLAYQTYQEKLDDLAEKGEMHLERELDLLDEKRREEEDQIKRDFMHREQEIEEQDKILQREFVTAKQELEAVQDRTGRKSPLIHFKSKILYFLLLLGIGICEVPLNLQIFQKFGEAFFITIIMASSLAIAIPVLAHFTGVFVKQRKEKKEYLWFGLMCVVLFFIFNFGVSIFRAYVLAETMGEEANQLNMVIFTCLNLILFVIGVLAAYFSHDESYELETLYHKFQKAKKTYDKERLGINAAKKALSATKNVELKTVHDAYMKEKNALHNKKSTFVASRNEYIQVYDELLNSFQALEEYLVASYHIAIGKYRSVNLMHRKDHLSPKSWAKGVQPLSLKFAEVRELDPN